MSEILNNLTYLLANAKHEVLVSYMPSLKKVRDSKGRSIRPASASVTLEQVAGPPVPTSTLLKAVRLAWKSNEWHKDWDKLEDKGVIPNPDFKVLKLKFKSVKKGVLVTTVSLSKFLKVFEGIVNHELAKLLVKRSAAKKPSTRVKVPARKPKVTPNSPPNKLDMPETVKPLTIKEKVHVPNGTPYSVLSYVFGPDLRGDNKDYFSYGVKMYFGEIFPKVLNAAQQMIETLGPKNVVELKKYNDSGMVWLKYKPTGFIFSFRKAQKHHFTYYTAFFSENDYLKEKSEKEKINALVPIKDMYSSLMKTKTLPIYSNS